MQPFLKLLPPGLAALVSAAAARMAFATLRDDEDDLYYEKGQATRTFLTDLVGGQQWEGGGTGLRGYEVGGILHKLVSMLFFAC